MFNYYGLDWLAMVLGFLGMWLLGKKLKVAFLFTAAAMIAGFLASILANQYGFIVSNAVLFTIAVRNYILWHKEERRKESTEK